MPFIHVSSNIAKADVDTDKTMRALSKSLANALGTSEQLLLVILSLDQPMLFAKQDDPCAFVDIRGIRILAEENPNTVKAITTTVTEALGVPSERVFGNLQQLEPTNWGWDGNAPPRL